MVYVMYVYIVPCDVIFVMLMCLTRNTEANSRATLVCLPTTFSRCSFRHDETNKRRQNQS